MPRFKTKLLRLRFDNSGNSSKAFDNKNLLLKAELKSLKIRLFNLVLSSVIE